MITAYDITEKLYCLFDNFEYKLQNTYVFVWESDFFCVSKSNYVYEIEVKISKADFKKDFEKRIGYKDSPLKHDVLKDNDSKFIRPNKFFFACPEGLINKEDIPDQYGLIWLKKHECVIVKPAKFLHKGDLFQNRHFLKQLLHKYYYRFIETSRELKIRQEDMCFRLFDKERL